MTALFGDEGARTEETEYAIRLGGQKLIRTQDCRHNAVRMMAELVVPAEMLARSVVTYRSPWQSVEPEQA